MTETLGTKIRRQRRRLGLTLDELSGRTAISKPYLSLIETGRVTNPPSDEKLRRLEQSLGFNPSELVSQAHVQRTPRDVRVVLQRLMDGKGQETRRSDDSGRKNDEAGLKTSSKAVDASSPRGKDDAPSSARKTESSTADDEYLSGILKEMADRKAGNLEHVASNAVPVINRVSAGYPRDFSDLGYPPRVANDFISCPGVHDNQAFGARVHGDSMIPKYREGDIVIFSPALSPRDGDDCFVRFADGNTTFKRVFFESDEKGKSVLRLQPRNERHRSQTTPAESVAGLYKAIYRYQRVDEE